MKKNEDTESLKIAVLPVSGKPARGYRLPFFNSNASGPVQRLRGHKNQLTVTLPGTEYNGAQNLDKKSKGNKQRCPSVNDTPPI